ncbi:MAG: DNA-3-methyladenine glycosylase [Saprospiraceae bacterium]|nr:DNA-3-methyladenine glycosylase [Saprospiraceae bacterium]
MYQLPQSFFLGENVQEIARNLLGKILLTEMDGIATACRIVETEAYAAPLDKASHAYGMRRTKRTETMYLEGGHSYVYLCYGIHHLFNIVTGPAELPHAILIRGGEPILNQAQMLVRRNKQNITPALTAGPGALSMALGIKTNHDGLALFEDSCLIKIMEDDFSVEKKDIKALPRVGINYAEEFVEKPWRYILLGSKWVSNRDGLKQ